ncbi:alpha/beta hydrolase [Synechococcus elongatus PCC 11802]|uniref:Alpha/beta hydrolase n=2 Tax=Synechococcus elongatus TaxID=32046 RepID=A0AAU6R5I5_SYNEL|nr:alpha/beta hydrolase [Synechococcus elongatus PCC 11802]
MNRPLNWALGLWMSFGWVPAQALETVTFSADGQVQQLAIADLVVLAQQGQAPSALSQLLQQAGLNSQAVRRFLNTPLPLSGSQLSALLDLGFGDRLVQELSRTLGATAEQLQSPNRISTRLAQLANQPSISVVQLLEVLPAQSLTIEIPRLLNVLLPLQTQFRSLGLELADVVPCLSDRSCTSR